MTNEKVPSHPTLALLAISRLSRNVRSETEQWRLAFMFNHREVADKHIGKLRMLLDDLHAIAETVPNALG